MMFSRELRDAVARGEVTVSIRRWSRPQVKAGGRYRTAGVVIEVDSLEVMPFSAVTDEDVAASGERDREALRTRAAHSGPIRDETLVHRVEFHVAQPPGVAGIGPELDVPERVEAYLAGQAEPKQTDLRQLHARVLAEFPGCRLWFSEGTNDDGKVVANPNIGYGAYTITYADGSSRESFRIGLSANTTGISVYVLGLEDKTFLARTYGPSIGKASVTGYCIKFRRLALVDAEVLQAAIRHGMTVDQSG